MSLIYNLLTCVGLNRRLLGAAAVAVDAMSNNQI